MTLKEILDKRANLWENMKNFLDSRTDEKGLMSEEDAAQYDKMEADLSRYDNQIARLQKASQIEDSMNTPANTPIVNGIERTPVSGQPVSITATKEYANALLTAIRTHGRSVSDVLSEGTDSAGGYLVPDEWDSRLIEALEEENIMRRLGTKISTSGDHKINIVAGKPTASWIDENGTIQFTDAVFDQKSLDAHKLVAAVKVSEELLHDNKFNLVNHLITSFGQALSIAEEDAFLNGTGVGKPLGIFVRKQTTGASPVDTNATWSTPITTKTGGAMDLKFDDLVSLVYALKRPYRRKASFVTHDTTIAAIRKLKDGNNNYVWQPSYQMGEPDRVLGYPVHTSAYCAQMPTTQQASAIGVAAFGDFSYYNIGDRGARSVKELRELFAGNGQVGYMMQERVDGLLVLPEAVQILYAPATT